MPRLWRSSGSALLPRCVRALCCTCSSFVHPSPARLMSPGCQDLSFRRCCCPSPSFSSSFSPTSSRCHSCCFTDSRRARGASHSQEGRRYDNGSCTFTHCTSRFVQVTPTNSHYHLLVRPNAGNDYMRSGDFARAASCYTAAIDVGPSTHTHTHTCALSLSAALYLTHTPSNVPHADP